MLGPAARRTLVTLALTLASVGGLAVPAWALPDLSPSSLQCTPAAVTTRPGDELTCRLDVSLLEGLAYDVTADITIPASTTFDPLAADNTYAVPDDPLAPTSVHFDAQRIGLMAASISKAVSIRLRVRDDGTAKPGDPIVPVATLRDSDGNTTTITAKPALAVQAPPALLKPSTLTCADANGDPLRPDDALDCELRLVNAADREDAGPPLVQVPIPLGMAWGAGGNESYHTDSMITWSPNVLPGGVPSGQQAATALRFRLVVQADAPAGSLVFPYAGVAYSNVPSYSLGSATVFGPQLTVAPGPAVLTASTLSCFDLDGLPLYAGDTLQCTLTVVDAPGKEDVADLTGSAPVPPGTTAAGATTDASGHTIVFDQAALGAVKSGATRATTFRLRVDAATEPGTQIAPAATVTGRSVGTDAPVTQHVTAPAFVVAVRPALGDSSGGPVAVVAAAGGPTATPPASKPTTSKPTKSSRACLSRRSVTVTAWPPKGQRWRTVSASFGGRKAKGKPWGTRRAYRIKLVFTGLPKGTMKVKITGRTTTGRTVRSTRSFRLCLKRL